MVRISALKVKLAKYPSLSLQLCVNYMADCPDTGCVSTLYADNASFIISNHDDSLLQANCGDDLDCLIGMP